MSNIKIISSGKYIPKIQITNKELEESSYLFYLDINEHKYYIIRTVCY